MQALVFASFRRFFIACICFEMLLPFVALAASNDGLEKQNVTIPISGGIQLQGEILRDGSQKFDGPQAAVLFLNPFGQAFSVYSAQAKLFAKQGHTVLSFNPRGWHGSEGKNTMNYDQLTRDTQDVITWLLAHYDVEPGKIGVTGISEGGGLALLLSAVEPRLGAVAVMSSWSDLKHSSLGNTQRGLWTGLLSSILATVGSPLKLLEDFFEQLKADPNYGTDLFRRISPILKLEAINRMATPILISHNYDDTLFPVNQMYDFYYGLQGPKRLAIFPGFHASAEFIGLFSQTVGPWHEVNDWFALHLKGQPSRHPSGIRVPVKNSFAVIEETVSPRADTVVTELFLQKQNDQAQLSPTGLTSEPLTIDGRAFQGGSISTGFPLLNGLKNLFFRSTVGVDIKAIKAPHALLLVAEPFGEDRLLFGIPRLTLRLHSTAQRGMLIAHVLDIAPDNKAKLVTHGVRTWTKTDRQGNVTIDIEGISTAWLLAADHRVGLAFDTVDVEYAPPTLRPYTVTFSPEAGASSLRLPWMKPELVPFAVD